jgi:exopolyphosphatase/guanosine-5'-triphosphate,3'-diphosphate pyrophosphatase
MNFLPVFFADDTLSGVLIMTAAASPVRPIGAQRFAALDLGTNNCRLLVAAPTRSGYRVLGGFSRIVRLGEGLSVTGRLGESAMQRTVDALLECADRIAAHGATELSCVATQACRLADNGQAFIDRVKTEIGLDLEVISAEEEARLAALGCAELVDRSSACALVVDIGGGSTELSFIDTTARTDAGEPVVLAWASAPIGVVGLTERWPETVPQAADWYEGMVTEVEQHLRACPLPAKFEALFARGDGQVIGTSGAVTSLAGVHLGLARYRRADVDGIWFDADDCFAAIERLKAMTPAQRAANPCIGRDRADLVVPGSAILEAVTRLWPAARLRVADRGLREGLLHRMARAHRERMGQA